MVSCACLLACFPPRLGCKSICPTCRQPQSEVTKLRRIFTLDFLCEREAKARNKVIPAALKASESGYRVDDIEEEGEKEKEGDRQKKEGSDDKEDEVVDDMDAAVFESTYAMWCARRDQGIALDNGKRLRKRKSGGRRGPGMHGGN